MKNEGGKQESNLHCVKNKDEQLNGFSSSTKIDVEDSLNNKLSE